ncbi:MAG TPA: ribonuclease III [Nitrospina sp.]|mgnify:CR=1 FL=1|jgi:ribonuclease-3|nr:ribonuclease III [Nitrospinota bacterium]MDP6336094.1 ribonuclease III [Nitrospinaceae bacterium]MDP7148925.1 ribonuclease III [Nitrospinaceae bacterium]HAX46165.1 ribonuclease III [Nitrospina sp.]|tara:strand:- start:2263 stop:2976 length:714 start_codon:yes stop_codon:yes gene_type:complete
MQEERIIELAPLQKTLNYSFNDPCLLNKALTHKSYANEIDIPVKNNERFEFLGDSVLDLIVSHYMILEYDDLAEGALSKIRAAVVNEACLAKLAKDIDLGQYLLLGKGEHLSGGRQKSSILANTFEALVGALFCDSNLETVSKILMPTLIIEIDKYKDTCKLRDFKSDLQEYTQDKLTCIPSYQVVGEMGPDHDKRFEVEVTVRNKVQGKGNGKSKKEAEQSAAMMALGNYLSINDE